MGELVVCDNVKEWYDNCLEPPCGQLNIANQRIYDVLGNILPILYAKGLKLSGN